MATTTNNPIIPGGTDDAAERDQARKLAERYRCPFVDLREQRIDPDLFRSIPAELMFRYKFVPLEAHDTTLVVAMADPSQLHLTDELSLLLGKRLQIKVATTSQIDDLLKRTEQSQRVLDQATEGFTLQVVSDDDDSDDDGEEGCVGGTKQGGGRVGRAGNRGGSHHSVASRGRGRTGNCPVPERASSRGHGAPGQPAL